MISSNGIVMGQIMDLFSNEEFLNYRFSHGNRTFSNYMEEEYLMILIDIKEHCFQSTKKVNNGIVPANPKYYDVISHFQKQNTIIWKQPVSIFVGDIVYIYIGSPYSAILFQCKVSKVNFQSKLGNTMELQLIKKYGNHTYSLEKLREHHLKLVRCIRKLLEETVQFLEKNSKKIRCSCFLMLL